MFSPLNIFFIMYDLLEQAFVISGSFLLFFLLSKVLFMMNVRCYNRRLRTGVTSARTTSAVTLLDIFLDKYDCSFLFCNYFFYELSYTCKVIHSVVLPLAFILVLLRELGTACSSPHLPTFTEVINSTTLNCNKGYHRLVYSGFTSLVI